MSIHSPILELCEQTGRHCRACGVCLQRFFANEPKLNYRPLNLTSRRYLLSLSPGRSYEDLFNAPFWARPQYCEKRLLASSCLSVHMEQLGSHRTDYREILYLRIYRKSVEKIQVSLKSGEYKGDFTRRPIDVLYHISLISC